MNEARQHICICGFQFREFPILEHLLGYFMDKGKLFEDIDRRRARFHPAFARRLQVEPVKKYFRELLWRIDLELASGQVEDAPFEFADLLLHVRRKAVELLRIDAN